MSENIDTYNSQGALLQIDNAVTIKIMLISIDGNFSVSSFLEKLEVALIYVTQLVTHH